MVVEAMRDICIFLKRVSIILLAGVLVFVIFAH